MNIFVVKNLLGHVSLGAIFRGITPFTVALILLLAIVVAFPDMVLWLPRLMTPG
jgi:TRAP-type C4-dicarboxylate transport system permease large subunit